MLSSLLVLIFRPTLLASRLSPILNTKHQSAESAISSVDPKP